MNAHTVDLFLKYAESAVTITLGLLGVAIAYAKLKREQNGFAFFKDASAFLKRVTNAAGEQLRIPGERKPRPKLESLMHGYLAFFFFYGAFALTTQIALLVLYSIGREQSVRQFLGLVVVMLLTLWFIAQGSREALKSRNLWKSARLRGDEPC